MVGENGDCCKGCIMMRFRVSVICYFLVLVRGGGEWM